MTTSVQKPPSLAITPVVAKRVNLYEFAYEGWLYRWIQAEHTNVPVRRIGSIPATQFVLTLHEGPHSMVDKPVTVATWDEADGRLLRWRSMVTSPGGGYWKSRFVITFADGNTYAGRFDIEHDVVPQLGKYVRQGLEFTAGFYRPPHMDDDKYQKCLAMYPQAVRDAARLWLETYFIVG